MGMEDTASSSNAIEASNVDEEKKDARDSYEWWMRWIQSAKKAAERHWRDAKESWDEYENAAESKDAPSQYPIFWSSVKTMEPAYYSRTPDIMTEREFDIKDDIAITACLITERLAQGLLKQFDLDAVMQAVVGDFIHADKTSLQVIFESDTEEVMQRAIVTQSAENPEVYLDDQGLPYEGEIFQDENGFFAQMPVQNVISKRIYLAALPYDEVLHTPRAKTEAEITEKAYYFCLTEDAARMRFPAEVCDEIQWRSSAALSKGLKEERTTSDGDVLPEKYIEGWECYSKVTKRIYWWSDQFKGKFLDTRGDEWKLKGFFPSTNFAISSKPSKNLYPTPAFKHLKPLLRSLTEEQSKVFQLLDAIDPRALVDSGQPELMHALMSRGNKWIGAKNMQSLTDKGGVNGCMYFLPVEQFTNALSTITTLEDRFKNDFFEWFGVPDILRGATDPVETATSQELKVSAAHDRFKFSKKQIAAQVRDGIRLMVDLALEFFDEQEMRDFVGYQYMDEADQARFTPAFMMLKSDKQRTIRIDIDTDTMSFADEQMRSKQIGEASQMVTKGLAEVAKMVDTAPDAARVGMKALLMSLERLSLGRKFQDGVRQTLEQVIEKAENPPQSPPPPDYEMLKIQNEQAKLQQDGQIKMQEFALEERRIALDERKEIVAEQIEQVKVEFQNALDSALLQIENQRVQIEQFKAQMQARESEMEEIRLARVTDLAAYQQAVQTAQTTAPAEPQAPMIIQVPSPQMPAINLNVEAGRQTRKRATVVEDPMTGQMQIISEEIPEEPAIGIL